MNDVTRILQAIRQGDRAASEQLLPLVYEELRKLAAAKLANEKPGQTLQATALVHEPPLGVGVVSLASRADLHVRQWLQRRGVDHERDGIVCR